MTKNKLINLNDHLFAQLERLSEEEMTPEKIEQECQRTGAIVNVANQIVRTADLQLKAVTILEKCGERFKHMMPLIGSSAE